MTLALALRKAEHMGDGRLFTIITLKCINGVQLLLCTLYRYIAINPKDNLIEVCPSHCLPTPLLWPRFLFLLDGFMKFELIYLFGKLQVSSCNPDICKLVASQLSFDPKPTQPVEHTHTHTHTHTETDTHTHPTHLHDFLTLDYSRHQQATLSPRIFISCRRPLASSKWPLDFTHSSPASGQVPAHTSTLAGRIQTT